eukprot:COSAG02_NODE_290_length_25531_cov_75.132392_2_plen_46_part_00
MYMYLGTVLIHNFRMNIHESQNKLEFQYYRICRQTYRMERYQYST